MKGKISWLLQGKGVKLERVKIGIEVFAINIAVINFYGEG